MSLLGVVETHRNVVHRSNVFVEDCVPQCEMLNAVRR